MFSEEIADGIVMMTECYGPSWLYRINVDTLDMSDWGMCLTKSMALISHRLAMKSTFVADLILTQATT